MISFVFKKLLEPTTEERERLEKATDNLRSVFVEMIEDLCNSAAEALKEAKEQA